MSDLKQMIKNEFDKDRGLSKKVAEIAGYKNPTPLYKFLNEPDRELDNFNSLLKIVRYLFPDREFELLDKYLRTVKPNKKTARVGLEYATVIGLNDLKEYLLNALYYSKNIESVEWGTLYKVYEDTSSTGKNKLEVIDALETCTPKSLEMKTLLKIFQVYEYYEMNLMGVINQLIPLIESNIEQMKDEFIKESLSYRLGIIMTATGLRMDKVDQVRKYGEIIYNSTIKETVATMMLIHMGNSFIFENYDRAMSKYSKALEICEGLEDDSKKVIQTKRSISFLQSYWGIETDILDYDSKEVSDVHNVAFYHIKKGEVQKGIELLDTINLDDLSDDNLGFHYFYRGLATGNEDYYYMSINHFKITGDKFYRKLALIELEKLGVNKFALMALSA